MAINSKSDLLAAGYKGYTGWDEASAMADYRATGGQGKYDPGTSASTPSAGGGVPNVSVPNTQDLLKQQAAQEDKLLAQYAAASAGQEALPAAYTRLTTQAGIPQLQSDIQTYKSQIYSTQDLIDRLEEDINSRTKGTLTSEAQRRRQIAAEATPLQSTLGRLATGLTPLTEQLTTATGNVQTQLQLEQAQQAKELQPLAMSISAFSDRAAREITGYTNDNQNQLNLLLQQLKTQGDLSVADKQAASALALKEQDWVNKQKEITLQTQQDIIKYNQTTGLNAGNDWGKYLQNTGPSIGGGSVRVIG